MDVHAHMVYRVLLNTASYGGLQNNKVTTAVSNHTSSAEILSVAVHRIAWCYPDFLQAHNPLRPAAMFLSLVTQ